MNTRSLDIFRKSAAAGTVVLYMTIFLQSCMKQTTVPPVADEATIENIQWYLTEVDGSPVLPMADARQPHILMDPLENQARGFAGCNTFFSSYEREGFSLTFGPVGATRMACPDLEMGLETSIFKALESTRTGKMENDSLLLMGGDGVLARFSQEKHIAVVGPVWQWTQTLYNDDREAEPENPENYTIQFLEDGTIAIKADCNQKGGTYSISPGEKKISIEISHSTMAACPEMSLEGEFVKGLVAGVLFFTRNDDLYIDLKYDTGTMRFSQK